METDSIPLAPEFVPIATALVPVAIGAVGLTGFSAYNSRAAPPPPPIAAPSRSRSVPSLDSVTPEPAPV